MKPFHTQITWITKQNQHRSLQRYDTCRDLFINYLGFQYATDRATDIRLMLIAKEVPEQGIQQIIEPANVIFTFYPNIDADVWGTVHNGYELSQNDETLLEAYYWLVLLERLHEYYEDDILTMIRRAPRHEWDYAVDQTRSIRSWKEYAAGEIVPTDEMFRYRKGPINRKRASWWNTKHV